MNIFMIIKVSVRAIWRNKTRSSLTMLGIIFGIAAVIVVLAIGKGASANMVAQIGKMGDNVVMIFSEQRHAAAGVHGGAGEDGHVQALLEALGVPFTGSPMKACALAMDKYVSKLLYREAGIPTPYGVKIGKNDRVTWHMFPAVIKPCAGGSSVGVSFAENEDELERALEKAFLYEDTALVEEKITGREFSVAVLGDAALPPVEIIPRGGAYDFENKYQSGMTDEICPAHLSDDEEKEIGRMALSAHAALGLRDFSRSDFILSENGKFYCLETNAIPGLTINSLLPKEAAAAGMDHAELCEKICALAAERIRK